MTTEIPAGQGANCFTCQVRARTEWCVLDERELKLINEAKKSRAYGVGEVIFHEGDDCDGVFCIEAGMVGLRKSDVDGHSVLLHLAHEGETVGYRAFLAGEPYTASAEVLEPSAVCFVPRAAVRQMLDHNPALGLRFLKHVAQDLKAADENILRNVTLSVRARFAHLLSVLFERYGVAGDDGELVLELPLSRQDLASMIGTTPESMSRTIKKLDADGVAVFNGRTVRVPNRHTLINEFEPDIFV